MTAATIEHPGVAAKSLELPSTVAEMFEGGIDWKVPSHTEQYSMKKTAGDKDTHTEEDVFE
ncbi:hypothetical protein LFM09_41050 [Lentzea alba]|uniref:hypothetical protein n=1 Tax=Lentzea alba TaxID=2714351 RepID=UPI0039BF4CE9